MIRINRLNALIVINHCGYEAYTTTNLFNKYVVLEIVLLENSINRLLEIV